MPPVDAFSALVVAYAAMLDAADRGEWETEQCRVGTRSSTNSAFATLTALCCFRYGTMPHCLRATRQPLITPFATLVVYYFRQRMRHDLPSFRYFISLA